MAFCLNVYCECNGARKEVVSFDDALHRVHCEKNSSPLAGIDIFAKAYSQGKGTSEAHAKAKTKANAQAFSEENDFGQSVSEAVAKSEAESA